MAGEATRAKAPLTFEDILILLMRRFVGPALASGLAIGSGLFAIYLLMGGLSIVDFEIVFLIFVPATLISAVGLAVAGIPAGYLVARRRYGYRMSLALLAAIGFAAGLVLPLVLGMWTPRSAFASLIFAPCGAVAALVWTMINADLFRHDDGA